MRELIKVVLGSSIISIPAMLVFIKLTGIDNPLVGVVFGLGGIAITAILTQRDGWDQE